jgi:hypothetical protein
LIYIDNSIYSFFFFFLKSFFNLINIKREENIEGKFLNNQKNAAIKLNFYFLIKLEILLGIFYYFIFLKD